MASAYHFHVGNHSRGKGHSAVSGAAYRAGEKLLDQRTGLTHNYSRREDVLYSAILAPKNAPEWTQDRGELWNYVEEFENAKNSRLAKDIDASLPWQLDEKHREYMVRDFAYDLTRKGFILDANIHAPHAHGDQKNIHVHMMITTRHIDGDDFADKKDRELDKVKTLEHWRERWAEIGAKQLEKMGYVLEAEQWRHGWQTIEIQKNAAIERGDLEFAATCDRPATQHIGRAALEIEARGEHSDRAQTIRDEQELKAAEWELTEAQKLLVEYANAQLQKFDRQRVRVGQTPTQESYAAMHEITRQYREQGEEVTAAKVPEVEQAPTLQPMHPEEHRQRQEERIAREEIREAARAEITQPIQMTPESIHLAARQAIEQWERSQEQGLEYGLGLGLEL
jgi:MobA/MobL family